MLDDRVSKNYAKRYIVKCKGHKKCKIGRIVANAIFVKRYTIVYRSFYINCFDQRGSRLEIKLTTYIYMLHDNESLVEPCADYRVIGFLGRPRIHATKRDECQDDDGRVILQTTSDFGIVYLQLKGNERNPPNFF